MSINLFGIIGEDVRASDVITKMQSVKSDTIELNIMSPGGSVIEGLAIYDELRSSDKKIITRAMGQAASIASIIFMAGDEREVADNAEIMIHNATVFAGGNKHELSGFIDKLDGIDQKLINIYATRTNLNEEQVKDLLDKETFMSANEAVEMGFATSKADSLALVAQYNKSTNEIKEPDMATEEETKAGFFAHMKAYFMSDVKNEDSKDKPVEDDAKDEGDKKEDVVVEDQGDSTEDPKTDGEDIPKEDTGDAENEADTESEDMKDLRAENEALKNKIAEAENKVNDEAVTAKKEATEIAGLIFDAMSDNKVTMHEAKNLCSKSLEDVKDVLDSKTVNATGRGKSPSPKDEPVVNHKEQWKALLKEDAGKAQAYYNKHQNEIRSEK